MFGKSKLNNMNEKRRGKFNGETHRKYCLVCFLMRANSIITQNRPSFRQVNSNKQQTLCYILYARNQAYDFEVALCVRSTIAVIDSKEQIGAIVL